MARAVMVLASLLVAVGCGQPSSPVEQQEKNEGAEKPTQREEPAKSQAKSASRETPKKAAPEQKPTSEPKPEPAQEPVPKENRQRVPASTPQRRWRGSWTVTR
jgi:outer membrane biosynthesis protein TonB